MPVSWKYISVYYMHFVKLQTLDYLLDLEFNEVVMIQRYSLKSLSGSIELI